MELEFDRARWTHDGEGFWLCLRVKIPQAARRFAEGMKQAVYTGAAYRKAQKAVPGRQCIRLGLDGGNRRENRLMQG